MHDAKVKNKVLLCACVLSCKDSIIDALEYFRHAVLLKLRRPSCFYRYEETTKDVAKWQSIVKANREAPTLKFATGREDVPRTTTTAALTAKFAPSGDFERQIAEMLQAAGAHNEEAVQEAEEALALKVRASIACMHEAFTCIPVPRALFAVWRAALNEDV